MAIIGHTGLLYHWSLPTNMLDMAESSAESSEVFLGKFFFYQFYLESVFLWEGQRHSLSILVSCLLFHNFLPIAENLLSLESELYNKILPNGTRTEPFFFFKLCIAHYI